jgi:hypothetical protein
VAVTGIRLQIQGFRLQASARENTRERFANDRDGHGIRLQASGFSQRERARTAATQHEHEQQRSDTRTIGDARVKGVPVERGTLDLTEA